MANAFDSFAKGLQVGQEVFHEKPQLMRMRQQAMDQQKTLFDQGQRDRAAGQAAWDALADRPDITVDPGRSELVQRAHRIMTTEDKEVARTEGMALFNSNYWSDWRKEHGITGKIVNMGYGSDGVNEDGVWMIYEGPDGKPRGLVVDSEAFEAEFVREVSRLGNPAALEAVSKGGTDQTLINRESGGRWDAQNNAMGHGGQAGHFGRVQFGHARLLDAKRAGVLPHDMTPEQFMASPELQMKAEEWHFADIDKFIQQRDLEKYDGAMIKGVPVTYQGMVNAAHLGGRGGLARFLRTGGEYDPADANGTRLSDYMRMGAESSAQGAQQPSEPQEPSAAAQLEDLKAKEEQSRLMAVRQQREGLRATMEELERRADDAAKLVETKQEELRATWESVGESRRTPEQVVEYSKQQRELQAAKVGLQALADEYDAAHQMERKLSNDDDERHAEELAEKRGLLEQEAEVEKAVLHELGVEDWADMTDEQLMKSYQNELRRHTQRGGPLRIQGGSLLDEVRDGLRGMMGRDQVNDSLLTQLEREMKRRGVSNAAMQGAGAGVLGEELARPGELIGRGAAHVMEKIEVAGRDFAAGLRGEVADAPEVPSAESAAPEPAPPAAPPAGLGAQSEGPRQLQNNPRLVAGMVERLQQAQAPGGLGGGSPLAGRPAAVQERERKALAELAFQGKINAEQFDNYINTGSFVGRGSRGQLQVIGDGIVYDPATGNFTDVFKLMGRDKGGMSEKDLNARLQLEKRVWDGVWDTVGVDSKFRESSSSAGFKHDFNVMAESMGYDPIAFLLGDLGTGEGKAGAQALLYAIHRNHRWIKDNKSSNFSGKNPMNWFDKLTVNSTTMAYQMAMHGYTNNPREGLERIRSNYYSPLEQEYKNWAAKDERPRRMSEAQTAAYSTAISELVLRQGKELEEAQQEVFMIGRSSGWDPKSINSYLSRGR